MKRIVLTSAIVLGLAAPAFAESQLERSLGVEAGVYTTSQLVQLKNAAEKTGSESTVFIPNVDVISTSGRVNAVDTSQLAASLGVDGKGFTVAELALIKDKSTFEGNEGHIYFGTASTSAATDARIADFKAMVTEQDDS